MKQWLGACCAALACGGAPAGALDEVRLFSSGDPPYVELGPDGRISGGLAVVPVLAILGKLGLPPSRIETVPWARAYEEAKTRPGAAIFPIAKTRERLKHLDFAVKLLDSDVYFYQLASRRDIQAPTLAAAKRYSVCVVLGDYRQEYLKEEGFPRLDPTSDSSINVKKLVSGRCDLLPATEIGMRSKLKSLGLDASLVRRGMKLAQLDSALYAAFNRGTAPAVIARFKAAARSAD